MLFSEPKIPQCCLGVRRHQRRRGFSALQRAENSSILQQRRDMPHHPGVSVLFSEPKIPQVRRFWRWWVRGEVSVLFSEPKIPQVALEGHIAEAVAWFQCSSASRKFLKAPAAQIIIDQEPTFQCSSASRKFLKPLAFDLQSLAGLSFQCSSASRKFLKRTPAFAPFDV